MDEATQSTDVTSDSSPVAAEASTSETAPSVGQSGEQTQERSGDDTAQSASEGTASVEGEATPPPSEEDPLAGLPSTDELEQQVQQRVPYAQALLKLRTALEARNSEVAELKGKTSTAEPVLPLVEQYGGTEQVQTRLQTYDKLFSPVLNPETQQPEIDPSTGFPRITATPFIESVDAENPGMAEQILFDTLSYRVDFGNGQKVPLYQHPDVQAELLRVCGLDPARADDYRNIDALSAPQDNAAVTPEDLAEIPAEFHETYKSLPPGIRADLKVQDEATRQFNLEVYKERADRRTAEAQAQQQAAEERQAAEIQVREYVTREQDGYVNQQIQETYGQIMAGVKSQVNLPEGTEAVVGALLFSLRDPDYRQANAQALEAMGVKLNPDFDQALMRADQHYRDAKRFELYRQGELSRQSLAKAKDAKNEVLAKLAPIALRAAKVVLAAQAASAKKQGDLLTDATRTRPVPGSGGETEEGGGVLPAGMLPNDPRAGLIIARQTGHLG